jgi:hypothetical protein
VVKVEKSKKTKKKAKKGEWADGWGLGFAFWWFWRCIALHGMALEPTRHMI